MMSVKWSTMIKFCVTEKDTLITIVASVPITATGWTPLPEGSVLALDRGEEITTIEET